MCFAPPDDSFALEDDLIARARTHTHTSTRLHVRMRFRLLKLARCSLYSIALKTLKVQEPNTTIGNQSLWTGDIGYFTELSQELVTLIVDMLGFADRFLFCKVPYVNEVVAMLLCMRAGDYPTLTVTARKPQSFSTVEWRRPH